MTAGLLVSLTASSFAYEPTPQLRHYQSVSASSKARTDLPLFTLRHSGTEYVGNSFELRGMVDGTMVVNGQRSFVLRVGQENMQIQLHGINFDASRGTSIWCVVRVMNSGQKVPPDMEVLAYVRSEDVVAWQRELDRRRQASSGVHHHFVWTAPWPTDDPKKQLQMATAWIQSFNPSLSDAAADNIAETVFRHCKPYNIDPRFALSLMAAESAFQTTAVSRVGAEGLGQLMPETAARLGVKDAFDIDQNVEGCTKFLNELLAMWSSSKDCLKLVLASYNAGPGAVKQFGGIPPYEETQSYVAYVMSLYKELGGKAD